MLRGSLVNLYNTARAHHEVELRSRASILLVTASHGKGAAAAAAAGPTPMLLEACSCCVRSAAASEKAGDLKVARDVLQAALEAHEHAGGVASLARLFGAELEAHAQTLFEIVTLSARVAIATGRKTCAIVISSSQFVTLWI